jgi:hypothetical protein
MIGAKVLGTLVFHRKREGSARAKIERKKKKMPRAFFGKQPDIKPAKPGWPVEVAAPNTARAAAAAATQLATNPNAPESDAESFWLGWRVFFFCVCFSVVLVLQ